MNCGSHPARRCVGPGMASGTPPVPQRSRAGVLRPAPLAPGSPAGGAGAGKPGQRSVPKVPAGACAPGLASQPEEENQLFLRRWGPSGSPARSRVPRASSASCQPSPGHRDNLPRTFKHLAGRPSVSLSPTRGGGGTTPDPPPGAGDRLGTATALGARRTLA